MYLNVQDFYVFRNELTIIYLSDWLQIFALTRKLCGLLLSKINSTQNPTMKSCTISCH